MPRFDPHVHTLTLLSKIGELDAARRAADAPTERPPRAIEYTVAYLHGDTAWRQLTARGRRCLALADEPDIVGVGGTTVVYGADVGGVVALAKTVANQRVVMVLPRDADPAAAIALARAEAGNRDYFVTQLPSAGEWSEVRVVTDNTGAVSVYVAPVVELEKPAPKTNAERRGRRRAQDTAEAGAVDEAGPVIAEVSGVALPGGVNALGDVVTPEAMASMVATFNAESSAAPALSEPTDSDTTPTPTEPTP
jgi:hypothetical protein